MTTHDLERMPPPLSPAVEALIAHESLIVELPETDRARLLARARESLRAPNLPAVGARKTPTPILRVVLAAAAGIALIASVAAAFQMMRSPTPPTKIARLSRPVELAPRVPPAPAAEPVLAPAAPTAQVPTARLAAAPSPGAPAASRRALAPGRGDSSTEELQLLDRARQSDARGDYASVLAIARAHESSYSEGRLAEEREVLRVKALVGLGRGNEARDVAARFRRQFPRSVLLKKIDDMLTLVR
jgi:hypothetical protein